MTPGLAEDRAPLETPGGFSDEERIASVHVEARTLPLTSPVRNGTLTITEREYAIVTVRSRDGVTGRAVAFTRGTPIVSVIRDTLAPKMVGRPSSAITALTDELARWGRLYFGRSGIYPRAVSLVDVALWDLAGQRHGISLARMLGAGPAQVPLLVALGYYRDGNDLDALHAEYAGFVHRGFRRFKAMAGGAPIAEDVRRLHAIFEVLPDDATLAVDVNGAFRRADDVLRFVDAVDRPLEFIEDPFVPDAIAPLERLRDAGGVTVAVGEWESGRQRFSELIRDGLVDILRLDATAIGGIGEWMRVAAIASVTGVRILPHYFPEIHVHLAAATPDVEAIEIVPRSTGADNFDELTTAVPWREEPVTGVTDAPGLGVTWAASVTHSIQDQATPKEAVA